MAMVLLQLATEGHGVESEILGDDPPPGAVRGLREDDGHHASLGPELGQPRLPVPFGPGADEERALGVFAQLPTGAY